MGFEMDSPLVSTFGLLSPLSIENTYPGKGAIENNLTLLGSREHVGLGDGEITFSQMQHIMYLGGLN